MEDAVVEAGALTRVYVELPPPAAAALVDALPLALVCPELRALVCPVPRAET